MFGAPHSRDFEKAQAAYDRQEPREAAEDHEDEFETQFEEGAEFDPFGVDNAREAIEQLTDEQIKQLCEFLRQRDSKAAGGFLDNYMRAYARRCAEAPRR
jgi:hypothetical protein